MGGSVSTLISGSKDDQILREMGALGYRPATKERLINRIRAADKILTKKKEAYGDGVSVKGAIANVSGYHFLSFKKTKVESGKDWTDPATLKPSGAESLDVSPFFHAKRDAAATGTRAGFVYNVLDRDGYVRGVVSIAWENPYFGTFTYMVVVSEKEEFLQDCLDHCANSSESKIEGDVKITKRGRVKEFITAKVMADDRTTAYLLIGIKTDDMIRVLFGDL